MRRTNNNNIPESICRLIDSFDHSHKDVANISCTSLIDAPLLRILKKKYQDSDELVIDYTDDIWKVAGSIVHYIIEQVEQNSLRVPTLIATVNGWTVSGMVDSMVFSTGILSDYKFSSSYTIEKAMKESKREWESQINVYHFLMQQMPELWAKIGELKEARIIAWGRDWGPRMKRDNGINPIEVIPISLWKEGVAQQYVQDRVALHQAAELSGASPCCSDEERWMKPPVWAVMKTGRKSSLKNCASMEEAQQYLLDNNVSGGSIDERAKQYPRCESYCAYSKSGLCPYFPKELTK